MRFGSCRRHDGSFESSLPTFSHARAAIQRAAARAGADASGERGGKATKQIRGRRDRFFRLRIGDHRVMYDVIEHEHERVLLVLGIVNRRDLERWLRGR